MIDTSLFETYFILHLIAFFDRKTENNGKTALKFEERAISHYEKSKNYAQTAEQVGVFKSNIKN